MEKMMSQEERIRRAEEIYQRRRAGNRSGIRVSGDSVNNTKTRLSLFKKMALQLAICSVIYIIFYLIKNTNYIFSEDVIHKTKELLSYDINFGNVYSQITSFVEENKDKFAIPGFMENKESSENNENNEQNQQNDGNIVGVEQNGEQIGQNIQANEQNNEQVSGNNATNEVTNTQAGGIGGAETNEVEQNKVDESTKKSQMELDAEYVKKKCSFKVPVTGWITSRYGAREKTDIVSANHYGIDIGANTGTPIYASMAGTVTVASSEGDYRKAY